MTEKRTITNGKGKTLDMMVEPENTIQGVERHIQWKISKGQWYRLVAESDNTAWMTKDFFTVLFTCPEMKQYSIKYPGVR